MHHQTIVALRKLPAQSAGPAVRLAATESKAKLATGEFNYKNADEWEDAEAKAVEHLVHTLDIIGLGFPNPSVGADPAHATLTVNGQKIDLVAIQGKTHEACIEHSKVLLPLPRRQTLLVSRDQDNTRWRKRFGSYLEPGTSGVGQERRFTDPLGGMLHLDYARLLDIFQNSPTEGIVQETIYADLAA